MLRRLKVLVFTVAFLALLGGRSQGAMLPEFFWNWGGGKLLSLVQAKINGKITARQIQGNPLTGLTYRDLTVTGPQGQVLLRVERLELSLSPLSIPSLHPIISRLALVKPRVYLVQEAGGWNLSRLARPRKPGAPSGITGFLFHEVDFSSLVVENGEIDVTRGGVTRRYTDLDLKSTVSLLDWGTPQEKLDLKQADLAVTAPQGRLQLAASLTYTAGLAQISALNLKLAGKQILTLKGELCQPLGAMTCQFTGHLGPLTGETIHGFFASWPAPWDLNGEFSFSSAPAGMKLAAAGSVGAATFDLKGSLNARVKPAVFKLDADLKGLATAQLQEIQGLQAKKLRGLSPVNAHVHLQGTGLPWNPQSLKGEVKLEAFQYRTLQVQRLKLDLEGTARSQDLNLSASGNFGALSLKASGHLLPVGEAARGASGEVTLKITELRPAPFGLKQYAGTELTGGFQGKFRLPPGYALARTSLAGTLEARGRVVGKPLDRLQARFSLEEKKLTLASADLRMASLAAQLKGTLSPSEVDLGFTAAVSGSRGLPVSSPASFGQLTAQGTVRGPWRELRITAAASGKNFSFQGVRLETANLRAELTGWPPQSGSIQVQGTRLHTAAGDFSRLALMARGQAGQWSFQVAATAPQKQPRFNLAGTADLRQRPLTIRVSQVIWQAEGLSVKNRAPFQVRLFPGYEISPATFLVDGGLVTVQGQVRATEVSGRLEVQNLDAGLLSSQGLPARGKISARLVLSGSARAPLLNGSLTLASGSIRSVPIQTLTTSLSYEDGRLQVSGHLEESLRHSSLSWQGTVPVSFSLMPLKFALGHQGLDLRVQSQRVNLSLLAAVIKQVQSANSPMELLVQLKGDPHQPQVSGYLRWGEGFVLVQQAGTPYSLAPGEIRLLGDKVTIPGIVLTSQGTFRLSGDLALAPPTSSRLRAQVDNFMLLNRGGNQLWSNGHVDLTGPLDALSASGRLTVPKAQFHPNFFRSNMDRDVVLVTHQVRPETAPPALYRNLRADVTIEAPGNVWLQDPVGKVELSAHLRATKNRGQKLILGGQIRALQGTVDVQDQEFKVIRATLTLPGAPGKPILVDAKATHAMSDADITLVLTVIGSVTNPQIRLESEPPLPPADVLSYLVFGAPSASITRDQYLALGAQTLGGLGGLTARKLGEILGGSVPFLSGMALKTGPAALGVEQKVTKNISVSYQRVRNEERGQYEQEVVLDYKINRRWSVESQLGTRNPGADVLFNYDF